MERYTRGRYFGVERFERVIPAGPTMRAVPTYLRWIAALSTGITAQLVFFLITYPLGSDGTSTTTSGGEILEVTGPTIFLALMNTLLSMSAALLVNNWILRRYPKEG